MYFPMWLDGSGILPDGNPPVSPKEPTFLVLTPPPPNWVSSNARLDYPPLSVSHRRGVEYGSSHTEQATVNYLRGRILPYYTRILPQVLAPA